MHFPALCVCWFSALNQPLARHHGAQDLHSKVPWGFHMCVYLFCNYQQICLPPL